ncbi:hypothetical protein QCE83_18505 [Caballeronia sp. LZ034LL]|nr:hypothetical protein [Caballeronia sp. LZ034LL]
MLTIYSSDHSLRQGVELKDGAISESFEQPVRASDTPSGQGGYIVDEIEVNAVNVLLGFEGRA